MLGSVILISVSVGLLLYWFRYSCLLIVQSYKEDGLASQVAQANGLHFLDVRARVDSADVESLDALYRSLEDDRRMLSYLLEHTAGPAIPAMERSLLALDYALMQFWYQVMKAVSREQARSALREMSEVIRCFAHVMGLRRSTRVSV
jgi:hypothetical protein